jgi:hypothetical protein
MTVLLDDGSAQPGTHLLLIGVGSYPHLNGGSAPPAKLFQRHMNMGQLSSPPLSAMEFALWFVDPAAGFNNPERPLRSLAMLCSAPQALEWSPAAGAKQAVAPATMANATQAITDWIARASRHEENLALLYFCGHGLSFGETQNSLLLEDFGSNALKPMGHAIAFDELRMGLMQQCAARYQCHFIDACRTLPSRDFVDQYGTDTGDAVVAGGLSKKLRNKVAPVFFATGLASAAYGLADQASLFAQGMLRSFRGVGSRDADDHWDVNVPAMAEGINKGVESLSFQTQPQYCQPRDTGQPLLLHRLRSEPEVIVKVSTRDDTLMTKAVLACTSVATAKRQQREPHAVPWWVPLPLGAYNFEALAADNLANILGQRSNKHVSPPGAEVRL